MTKIDTKLAESDGKLTLFNSGIPDRELVKPFGNWWDGETGNDGIFPIQLFFLLTTHNPSYILFIEYSVCRTQGAF